MTARFTVKDYAALSPEDQQAFMATLEPLEAAHLAYDWRFWARDDQLPPDDPDWLYWMLLAGRGAGKTRAGAEWVRDMVEAYWETPIQIALVGPTAADVRDVMVDGPSGLLSVFQPGKAPKYQPTRRRVLWPNGSKAFLYSAEQPDRLRGPQHHFAWCDELAAWQYGQDTWDMLQFGLRLGDHPRAVITTTPRPIKLVRDLVNDPACRISHASTYDNLANLAPVFLDRIVKRYEGTRLGMQELYAKLLTDNPDALWNRGQLEGLRINRPPQDLDRIVVAVDPPTTSGENADECGIVVAGCRGKDWRTREAFVLADASSQGEKPNKWAWRVINTAKLYGADAIIVETNQGGEMVMETISALDRSIPIKGVHASKGKYTRAEPVAAWYEQGKVHHVGHLAKLEDQMTEFTIDFDPEKAGYSPDRLDALVYAVTELLNPPGRAGSRSQ